MGGVGEAGFFITSDMILLILVGLAALAGMLMWLKKRK
jgi:LPXTG-motif cell wall-anchored protein